MASGLAIRVAATPPPPPWRSGTEGGEQRGEAGNGRGFRSLGVDGREIVRGWMGRVAALRIRRAQPGALAVCGGGDRAASQVRRAVSAGVSIGALWIHYAIVLERPRHRIRASRSDPIRQNAEDAIPTAISTLNREQTAQPRRTARYHDLRVIQRSVLKIEPSGSVRPLQGRFRTGPKANGKQFFHTLRHADHRCLLGPGFHSFMPPPLQGKEVGGPSAPDPAPAQRAGDLSHGAHLPAAIRGRGRALGSELRAKR